MKATTDDEPTVPHQDFVAFGIGDCEVALIKRSVLVEEAMICRD
jgi:hypothetical protein